MLPSSTAARGCGSLLPGACPPINIFLPNSIISNSTIFTGRCSSLATSGCRAAKRQQQRLRRQSSTSRPYPDNQKKKKKKKLFRASEKVAPPVIDGHESPGEVGSRYRPSALPKPPAGFVLDSHGRVLVASSKRIATIVDSANNLPLECVIRRVFKSAQGDDCMLLCPVDTPVQILKSTNFEGWAAVTDEDIETIIPSAAYALAKIHMHLVLSGFCYTARGGFCYSEDDVLEFRTDDGQEIVGLPAEGIEITCFHMVDGSHYMIYTPSDPLLFVAVKNGNGFLEIAPDELLDDPAIVEAIDEETEFNALVEEEAALLQSVLGEG